MIARPGFFPPSFDLFDLLVREYFLPCLGDLEGIYFNLLTVIGFFDLYLVPPIRPRFTPQPALPALGEIPSPGYSAS